MTDTQWLRICSLKDAHGRLRGSAALDGTDERT